MAMRVSLPEVTGRWQKLSAVVTAAGGVQELRTTAHLALPFPTPDSVKEQIPFIVTKDTGHGLRASQSLTGLEKPQS